MLSVPDHFTTLGGHNSTRLQLCRCATCNRNCTYTKLCIINRISRLDSTLQCLSSFVQYIFYHGVTSGIVVRFSRNWELLTVIQTHIHSISRGISRGFEIFRLLSRPFATAYCRRKKRVYFYGLEMGLERQT